MDFWYFSFMTNDYREFEEFVFVKHDQYRNLKITYQIIMEWIPIGASGPFLKCSQTFVLLIFCCLHIFYPLSLHIYCMHAFMNRSHK